jgi:ribonuclease-3 family protein
LTHESFDHGQLPGSLELAFMGDTIYDLRVREYLVRRGGRVRDMHREASRNVCAHAQSEAFGRIEGMLTEEESHVARRARNAHQNPPRNADPAEYHRATALEALIGYLYLTGQTERMNQLLDAAVSIAQQDL